MKKKAGKRSSKTMREDAEKELTYPPYEDIVNKDKKVHEIDPDDVSKPKAPKQKPSRY
jgi:hypothetical protein